MRHEQASFLVCCEHSGAVRAAMRSAGIDAYSCDLLPADDGSPYHIQGDCRDAMKTRNWTGFGMHPDCTYLTVAGIHWNNRGRGWERTHEALDFVRELMALAGDRPWYLENPVSIISTHIRRPDQIIQPYQFGDDASKATCLWLNRLPPPGSNCARAWQDGRVAARLRQNGGALVQSNRQRAKPTAAIKGPVEGSQQNLRGHRCGHGIPVVRRPPDIPPMQ